MYQQQSHRSRDLPLTDRIKISQNTHNPFKSKNSFESLNKNKFENTNSSKIRNDFNQNQLNKREDQKKLTKNDQSFLNSNQDLNNFFHNNHYDKE